MTKNTFNRNQKIRKKTNMSSIEGSTIKFSCWLFKSPIPPKTIWKPIWDYNKIHLHNINSRIQNYLDSKSATDKCLKKGNQSNFYIEYQRQHPFIFSISQRLTTAGICDEMNWEAEKYEKQSFTSLFWENNK